MPTQKFLPEPLNRLQYDSSAGIESYLTDLDGLNRLMAHRMRAGYDRKEHLREFVIMGRWATDSCGNFGRCTFAGANKPVEIPKHMPKVLTRDAAFNYFGSLTGTQVSMTTYHTSDVPPSHVICPMCKKAWALANAHDTFVTHADRTVPLTVGKTIADRQKDWDSDPEGVFRFNPEPSVRNDKFVDPNPHPEFKNEKVNEGGWRYHHPPFNHEVLSRAYVAEEGDEASITVFTFHHKRCWELMKARNERKYFEDIFDRAGLKPMVLDEIPNGYCPCERCAPWYVAKFPLGDIKIGWRKRVISIDWSSTGHDLLKLFKDEPVTKEPGLVHAYGTDKAVDYLSRIKDALTL
jgi:hypothetical protein